MSRQTERVARILASRVVQGSLLALAVLVILFVFVDSLVMPRYTRQGTERAVPAVIGMTLEQADSALAASGFRMVVESAKIGSSVAPGCILEQRPLPKALAKPGRKIRVVPAKEAGTNAVPYLIGLDVRDAQVRARNSGLACGQADISYQFSHMTAKGLVLEQTPIEGDEAKPGTAMRLVVSLGPVPDDIRVPLLTEKSLHDARMAILEAGLELGNVTRKETDVYIAGTVIAQSHRSGLEVDRGTRIDVVVAVPVSHDDSLGVESDEGAAD